MLVYFAMSYLLIGGVFLGIGGQASTVREVQTLSMPVTMAQVVIFGLASLGVGKPDGREAIGAAIFPLSSPYAMIAPRRRAGRPVAAPLAFAWQVLWVALILKFAAALFRRSVLKSGPSRRWPWQRPTLLTARSDDAPDARSCRRKTVSRDAGAEPCEQMPNSTFATAFVGGGAGHGDLGLFWLTRGCGRRAPRNCARVRHFDS